VERLTDLQEADVNFAGHALLFRMMGAVLKEVDTLPDPKGKTAVINGNGQAGLGKRCADVGGRVVRPFNGMFKPGLVFGHQALIKIDYIHARGRVKPFTDGQRSTDVRYEEKTHAFLNIMLYNQRFDTRVNLGHPLTFGFVFQNVLKPFHGKLRESFDDFTNLLSLIPLFL